MEPSLLHPSIRVGEPEGINVGNTAICAISPCQRELLYDKDSQSESMETLLLSKECTMVANVDASQMWSGLTSK